MFNFKVQKPLCTSQLLALKTIKAHEKRYKLVKINSHQTSESKYATNPQQIFLSIP